MAPKTHNSKKYDMLHKTQKRNQKKSGKKMDIIGKLPLEVAEEILMSLNPDDIVMNAWNTSQIWRSVMGTEYFWKKKCMKDNFFLTECSVKSKVFKNLSEKFSPWHATYRYNQGLNYNWKNRNFHLTNLGDALRYESINFSDDEKIIYTTSNRDLVMMDYATGVLNQMVRLNSREEIEILKKHEDLLICVSQYNLYVWNIRTTKRIFFMPWIIQDYYIEKLQIYGKSTLAFVDSGGSFSTINLQSGAIRNVRNDVSSLVKNKNLAVLQIGFSEVTILNMAKNSSLVARFTCSEEKLILKMLSTKNYLICFCEDGNVSTWDILTQTKLMFVVFQDPLYLFPFFDSLNLLLNDQFIYTRNDGHVIEIWDFLLGTCVMQITTKEIINRLVVTARYIFAMVDFNNGVKVFCSKTGKLITTLSSEVYYNEDGFPLMTESKLVVLMPNETHEGFLNDIAILDYEKQLSIP